MHTLLAIVNNVSFTLSVQFTAHRWQLTRFWWHQLPSLPSISPANAQTYAICTLALPDQAGHCCPAASSQPETGTGLAVLGNMMHGAKFVSLPFWIYMILFFMINAFYHADVDLLLFLTCVDRGSCYEWCLPMERWWSILQLPPSPSRSAVRATATTMACSIVLR